DLAFHLDGEVLAAACKDRTLTLWDPRTGFLRHTYPLLPGQAQNAVFSPDGRLLAASDWAGTVQIRDFVSGVEQTVSGTPAGLRIWSLAFSPDSRLLAAAGTGGVQLWQVHPGAGAGAQPKLEPETTPRSQRFCRCVCFSPDGHWLAWNKDTSVKVWD